ncbi:GTPase family protein [Gloeothece verrucosa]|uniref:GTP-binding protein HSR1-related protein n=1 Tax=Gloeothece verrucosa (strain PCC 7822) TaxID=497965 RepID=E0UAK6_GLOV7|nr:GTPase family protein [Gloeothece verrucosa]ADN12747.1 GTP-binding protein HSR1-related protein [Gloeothece verrucosa PCC 7822]
MIRLKLWQWIILATPLVGIIGFIVFAAGQQIHTWGINWIWGVFILILAIWRWLLAKWTQPVIQEMESVLNQVNQELEISLENSQEIIAKEDIIKQAEAALEKVLKDTQNDPPMWEDWQTFWGRCQELVTAIANIFYPEVKYPLLNIYVPQAYTLIRGTVDDLDLWMQKLSPALNQVSIGQAVQAYEVYQKLEPSARKLLQAWNWAQWLLNPAAAVAKIASERYNNQAGQQLIVNLGQILREAALRNLCHQALALYGHTTINLPIPEASKPALPKAKTQTLREILTQAEPVEEVEQKPLNILVVGRTGAGKSSLINTLFQSELAEVDVLPSTEQISQYHWKSKSGDHLSLWDTPGYEQVKREDLRELVLDYATTADLLLLINPALDPALQMDVDFLKDIREQLSDLPIITVVTQVDRLRPIREWEPPYNWQWGDRPKEIAIREAVEYRALRLAQLNLEPTLGQQIQVLPVVTRDFPSDRPDWGVDMLSLALISAIAPASQLRLARFLRNLEARTLAATQIIDHYTFQMTTTQGVTALLKSPVLKFLATLSTGSPTLAYVLAEQIPVEQLPVVIGKLQMAYDLFNLLNTNKTSNFDLLALWPLLLENPTSPERNAWAFGHALVEYWTKDLTIAQLRERFQYYISHTGLNVN